MKNKIMHYIINAEISNVNVWPGKDIRKEIDSCLH